MNPAMFNQWVRDRVEDLVSFGVSRDEAEALMHTVSVGAMADEAKNRSDAQFLLDFKRVGAVALAERHRVTPQAIRKRRRALLKSHSSVAPSVAL